MFVGGPCDGQVSGAYVRDPNDCGKYFRCVHDTANQMSCNVGLHFDLSCSCCNYPAKAGCAADLDSVNTTITSSISATSDLDHNTQNTASTTAATAFATDTTTANTTVLPFKITPATQATTTVTATTTRTTTTTTAGTTASITAGTTTATAVSLKAKQEIINSQNGPSTSTPTSYHTAFSHTPTTHSRAEPSVSKSTTASELAITEVPIPVEVAAVTASTENTIISSDAMSPG